MNNKEFREILESKSMLLTYGDIMEILDEELQKDEEEMDTDLIELCTDALLEAQERFHPLENVGQIGSVNDYIEDPTPSEDSIKGSSKQRGSRASRFKISKLPLIAAVIVLLCSCSIVGVAVYSGNNSLDGIVQDFGGFFKVALNRETEDDTEFVELFEGLDLIAQLEDQGVTNVIIPTELLGDEYLKSKPEVENNEDGTTRIAAQFSKEGEPQFRVTLAMYRYPEEFAFNFGNRNIVNSYEDFEQFEIDGLEILVFSEDIGIYHILYIVENTEYEIVLRNATKDMAVAMAESIKVSEE